MVIKTYINDINGGNISDFIGTLKMVLRVEKTWKATRKTYQNLRILQGKYLWRSFVIVNEQKVTSNEQKLTSNKQKVTSDEQRVKTKNNEQKITSNKHQVQPLLWVRQSRPLQ